MNLSIENIITSPELYPANVGVQETVGIGIQFERSPIKGVQGHSWYYIYPQLRQQVLGHRKHVTIHVKETAAQLKVSWAGT
jgi:hypothetical protein